MKKEKLTDIEKLHGCCVVIKAMLTFELTEQDYKTLVSKVLGNDWSYTAIVQYLSNKKALAAANSLPNDYNANGLNKAVIMAIVTNSDELKNSLEK